MSFHTEIESGIDDQLAEAGETLLVARDGQSVSVTGVYGNPE
jgi:hypothetical protein